MQHEDVKELSKKKFMDILAFSCRGFVLLHNITVNWQSTFWGKQQETTTKKSTEKTQINTP